MQIAAMVIAGIIVERIEAVPTVRKGYGTPSDFQTIQHLEIERYQKESEREDFYTKVVELVKRWEPGLEVTPDVKASQSSTPNLFALKVKFSESCSYSLIVAGPKGFFWSKPGEGFDGQVSGDSFLPAKV